MTDDELISILDVRGLWLVRAAGSIRATIETLRGALHEASRKSAEGVPVTSIVRMPNDEVIIPAEQIYRLWKHLKLV